MGTALMRTNMMIDGTRYLGSVVQVLWTHPVRRVCVLRVAVTDQRQNPISIERGPATYSLLRTPRNFTGNIL